MKLVWRGTFIDEALPEATSRRRAVSAPSIRSSSDTSPFSGECEYVAELEVKALQLAQLVRDVGGVPLVEIPKTEEELVHRRTLTAKSAASTASSLPSVWSLATSEAPTMCPSTPRALDLDFQATISGRSEDGAANAGLKGSFGRTDIQPATPASAWSVGSEGHPGFCERPCLQLRRGLCLAGQDCSYCHLPHTGRTPHLDKRNRAVLNRLSFGERAFLALPILTRQATKATASPEAQRLLDVLKSAAIEGRLGDKSQRYLTHLTSALGALSFRTVMTSICKAPDTPEGLQAGALEEQLKLIRC